jgi:hypothetical protein
VAHCERILSHFSNGWNFFVVIGFVDVSEHIDTNVLIEESEEHVGQICVGEWSPIARGEKVIRTGL